MSEKQKFAKSEKKLTLLSKTVENSEIRVKEFAKKIMLHRRAAPRNSNMQKTKLQISSTYTCITPQWLVGGTNCLIFFRSPDPYVLEISNFEKSAQMTKNLKRTAKKLKKFFV